MNETHRSKTALLVVALCSAFAATSRVNAQEQVNPGPVEIIVPWGTGGGADHLARQTAKQLPGSIGRRNTALVRRA